MIFLWHIWQAPQSLTALALIKILKAKLYKKRRGKKYFLFAHNSWLSGVSLGEYILLPEYSLDPSVMDHEYGHSIQSRILGPLYLLVIGVPSAFGNNLWDRIAHKHWTYRRRERWYYARYPEAWADRLGGVERL